jgi:hypothetical protein
LENKTCNQCEAQFVITDDDLDFLKRISPTLNGELVLVSPPSLCHECRQIRRYTHRNERHLYKRKCDLTSEDIVSVYSPDKPYKVYSNKAWNSDGWDPMSFGQDYNPNKTFFDQFNELLINVPRQANNAVFNENCDFCNQTWHSSDSYMCFNMGYSERCYYSNEAFSLKDCIDCFDVRKCEFCYSCFDTANSNNCTFLEHCKDCSDAHFSFDCAGCHNIFLCSGLKNKEFCIENQQYSKEEYLEKIKEFKTGNRSETDKLKEKFDRLKLGAIHKENSNIKSENCTGDYVIESNNCHDCFNVFNSQNCMSVVNCDDQGKDCRDINYIVEGELLYEGTSVSGYKNVFSAFMPHGSDNYYCNFCETCKNCFGCIAIKHKEYCILNKQYTKEEYESLVTKIIEKMKQDSEWGEFLPSSMSTFAYNETVAMDYFPKSKEDAANIGAYWQENDYETKYDGESYEPKDDINEYINSNDEVQALLKGVIKCEKSGKPFRIIPQEIAFYMKNQIPVPTIHPHERFMELFKLRNPRKLYERQCDCDVAGHDHTGRCDVKFKTTYSPERPEKVYCEKCYQKVAL